jgi:hypothetical protein
MYYKYSLCRHDLKCLYDLLEKWLVHDRFGLHVRFGQDKIERLHGVHNGISCRMVNQNIKMKERNFKVYIEGL